MADQAEGPSDEEIEAKVIEIVADVFDVDKSTISRETSFSDDLHAKSDELEYWELTTEFETEFDIFVPEDDKIEKLRTVGAVIDFIKAAISQQLAERGW